MRFAYLPGQTPLDPNEIDGLIPTHITLQRELNEFELLNISKAVRKYLSSENKVDLTDPISIKKIHKDMFDETWKWAGRFRNTIKSIGVFPEEISEELKKACDDLAHWIAKKTYSLDEIAVRFHHRLVWIHLFPNGNGRHSRLVADILLFSIGTPLFTWGSKDLNRHGPDRVGYISALKEADSRNYSSLLALARK